MNKDSKMLAEAYDDVIKLSMKDKTMTSDELQNQLNQTWYRDQSADDAHDAIWGEPFEGYTVSITKFNELKSRVEELLSVIEAHDVQSENCNGTEDKYCDCLSRSVEVIKKALAE